MADEAARASVLRLRAQLGRGADRIIGAAVGLDSGGISQIARGARGPGYGRARREALGELEGRLSGLGGESARGRAATLTGQLRPPARTTRAGETARVRKGAREGARGQWELAGGKASKGAALLNRLRRAGDQPVFLAVRVTTDNGPIEVPCGPQRRGQGTRPASEWLRLLTEDDEAGEDFEQDDAEPEDEDDITGARTPFARRLVDEARGNRQRQGSLPQHAVYAGWYAWGVAK